MTESRKEGKIVDKNHDMKDSSDIDGECSKLYIIKVIVSQVL